MSERFNAGRRGAVGTYRKPRKSGGGSRGGSSSRGGSAGRGGRGVAALRDALAALTDRFGRDAVARALGVRRESAARDRGGRGGDRGFGADAEVGFRPLRIGHRL